MTYEIEFDEDAYAEWRKLDKGIRDQFKKKLDKLRNGDPRVPANALRGLHDCYKIKLRSAGFRLVYRVEDAAVVIFIVAVGKRERNAVYDAAANRL